MMVMMMMMMMSLATAAEEEAAAAEEEQVSSSVSSPRQWDSWSKQLQHEEVALFFTFVVLFVTLVSFYFGKFFLSSSSRFGAEIRCALGQSSDASGLHQLVNAKIESQGVFCLFLRAGNAKKCYDFVDVVVLELFVCFVAHQLRILIQRHGCNQCLCCLRHPLPRITTSLKKKKGFLETSKP
jgi:hypothetical protein